MNVDLLSPPQSSFNCEHCLVCEHSLVNTTVMYSMFIMSSYLFVTRVFRPVRDAPSQRHFCPGDPSVLRIYLQIL